MKNNVEVLYMFQEQSILDTKLEILEESVLDGKKTGGLKYKMILQETETENQNRRKYIHKALADGMYGYQSTIKTGRAFCEENHPAGADVTRFTSIDLGNINSRILQTTWNKNILNGTLETLNNAKGKDLRGLIEQGIPCGYSMRGLGKTMASKTSPGITEVVSNMKIIAFDNVANPSHKNAVLQSILEENIITDDDVVKMLLSESDKLQLLRESLHNDNLAIFEDSKTENNIHYNLFENTVQFCTNGSCMKVFLEEHIQNEFKSSFSKLLIK